MSKTKKQLGERKRQTLGQTRRYYKRIARELSYPQAVIDDLDTASNEDQMSRIMTKARVGDYNV